jgi:hypothetical protein
VTPDEQNIADRLQDLLQLQLEGRSSAAEKHELGEILRAHPWTQELYVDFIQDTASLRWWSTSVPLESNEQEIIPASPQAAVSRGLKLNLPLFTAVAASILVLLTAATISYFRQPPVAIDQTQPPVAAPTKPLEANPPEDDQDKEIVSPASVATIARLRGVEWSGNEPMAEMSRLSVGQTVQFKQGEMEIYFDQAVKLVVRGPANVTIRSAREIYSSSGVLAARVGEAGVGFTIVTPTGRIIDLGTEFGVAIGDEGATDVAVFRGAVDLTYGARQNKLEPSFSRRLVQGQGLRLDSDGNMRRLMSIDDAQFPSVDPERTIPRSQRPAVITDVRDNIRDGLDAKFYRIVPGGLVEDALAYVDREHEWNGIDDKGIPPLLLGADYVMPFNVDKYISRLNVNVKVGRPAALFVFLSPLASVPKWLSDDFVLTDMKIGLDESKWHNNPQYRIGQGPGVDVDTAFSVWRKDILKPMTVTLGNIKQGKAGSGYCMYGIAALPLENTADAK